MENTFKKEERISGKKDIDRLFAGGKTFVAYPFKVIFLAGPGALPEAGPNVSILISVPKRKLKRAVSRNRVKRLVREIYRLNKNILENKNEKSLQIGFIYLKNEVDSFGGIEKGVKKAFEMINRELS